MLSKSLVFFMIFLTIGLGISAVGYAELSGQVSISEDHEMVTSQITDIEYEEHNISARMPGREIRMQQPTVHYTYTYDNNSYEITKQLPAINGDLEYAKEVVSSDYNVNDTQKLYVAESNPAEADQDRPSNFSSYVLVLLGIIITGCTLLLGNYARKS